MNKHVSHVKECLYIPNFEISLDDVYNNFEHYNQLFFFTRRGLVDIIDRSLELSTTDHIPSLNNCSYNDYYGLKAEVFRALDAFEDKYYQDRTPTHPNVLDTIELAVDLIEEYVDGLVRRLLPPKPYTIKKKRWEGTRCFVDLEVHR